jgi:WD40 repeat protein
VWNALTYGGGILRRGGSDVDRTTISPGGLQLALHNAKTQTLEVWDTRQGKPAWTLRGSEAQVTALAFSPDSSRLATGSADKTLRIWNASTGQPLASGKLAAVITSLAFTADGARLLSGSADHALSVWSSVSIEHKSDLPMRLNITSSAYSPDAKRIAAGIEGTGDIQVWDAGAGRLLTTLKGHAAPVDALAFSPDGSRIVSGSRDKTIRVWDAATYDPLLVLGDHDEAIASLAFSPDGARIHSASPDGTVRIWETRQ